jgi:hypothetical protein
VGSSFFNKLAFIKTKEEILYTSILKTKIRCTKKKKTRRCEQRQRNRGMVRVSHDHPKNIKKLLKYLFFFLVKFVIIEIPFVFYEREKIICINNSIK